MIKRKAAPQPEETSGITEVWPNPAAKPTPALAFLGADEDKTPKGRFHVNDETALDCVVREPFRIVIDGKVHTAGAELHLPDDERTRFWLRARWIERAPQLQEVSA